MNKIVINSLLVLGAIIVAVNSAPVDDISNVASQIQSGAQQAADQATQQALYANSMLGKQLEGLYNRGSKLASDMQPEIANIGKDVTMVYNQAKQNIIDPLSQNAKPYLENARNAVQPIVNNAQETVPQLVNQAIPAIQNVSQQVGPALESVRGQVGPALESLRNQFAGLFSPASGQTTTSNEQESAQQPQPSQAQLKDAAKAIEV